jgi:anti-anti-sigma factor
VSAVRVTRKAELEAGLAVRELHPGTTVVSMLGDCDLEVADDLESTLSTAAAGGATRIVVDLREATMVDSSALHALLAGRERAAEAGAELTVVCDRPSIVRVLELTGIDRLIPIQATLEQATDAARHAAG